MNTRKLLNIKFCGFWGSETALAVPEEKVMEMVRLYCNGNENWVFRGKKYTLSDNSEILILTMDKAIAFGIDLNSASEVLLSQLERHVDKVGLLGEVVSDNYFAGAFGEKKFGPLMNESNNGTASSLINSQNPVIEINKNMRRKRIFISHRKLDEAITTPFVMLFLRNGLEIDVSEEVYYTSHVATGISGGNDFRQDIKDGLINADVVICFISDNFKQSQYCIAEVGAAWAFDKKIIPICIPPYNHVQSEELLGPLQYIHGNNRLQMSRLRDDLVRNHGLGKTLANSALWEEALQGFLSAVLAREVEIAAGKK